MISKTILHIALTVMIITSTFAQSNCKVPVNIVSDIDSSLIFIDDELVGKGSADIELDLGEYKILLMKSDKEWGGNVITDSIQIESCDDVVILNYNFNEMTLVASTPAAAVIKNDSTLGYTPLTIPLKYQSVRLEKDGYSSVEMELKKIPIQEKVKLYFTGVRKDEPFIDSSLFKILVGSAVALGATAAYFKLEADDRFDKYLETRRSDYLDDTDRFDLYSGLAFGALQLNFGALLYYFLIE